MLWDRIKEMAAAILSLPCLFRLFTGLYCPGCGGTRAVLALLSGNIRKSFFYHPFVPYMAAAAAVEGVLWLAGRIFGKPVKGFEKRYRLWTVGALLVVLANWIFKNYMLIVKGTALM